MKRWGLLDTVRGAAVVSMVGYHTVWDLVWMFDVRLSWFPSRFSFLWQQSICWTFLLLSGFCQPFGRRNSRRGLQVFLAGGLVTAVTLLVMPENRVVFGILTLTGSCMLLCDVIRKMSGKAAGRQREIGGETAGSLREVGVKAAGGRRDALFWFFLSWIAFFLCRNVNDGYLGWRGVWAWELPKGWYRNLLTAYLGFPAPDFFSTDYFSLIPWCFLFAAGYFANRLLFPLGAGARRPAEKGSPLAFRLPPFDWIGRHALLIYLLHQPIIYGLLRLVFRV